MRITSFFFGEKMTNNKSAAEVPLWMNEEKSTRSFCKSVARVECINKPKTGLIPEGEESVPFYIGGILLWFSDANQRLYYSPHARTLVSVLYLKI